MLPGGFVDGGEDAEDFVLVREVIEKMGKSAEYKNYDDAKPSKKCLIHGDIIAFYF